MVDEKKDSGMKAVLKPSRCIKHAWPRHDKKKCGRRIDVTDISFPVARLHDGTLRQLQQLEQRLREETGEEIVLVAYQRKTMDEGRTK
jgi:hypothetical protein